MRFNDGTESVACGTVDGGLTEMVLRFPLHGDRDGPAVELDPRDLDRVHDPGGHFDEDRGSHANLERPGSDDPGFLKSGVAHRGPSGQAAGEGAFRSRGRPYGARIGYPYFNLAQRLHLPRFRFVLTRLSPGPRLESPGLFVTSDRRDCSFWPTILMCENPGGQLMNSKLHR